MNILEVISSIVKSLAWPALILFFFIFFSGEIKELFGSLREFSFSKDGFKGTFDRKAREINEDIVAAKIEFAATLPPKSRKMLDEKERQSKNIGRIVSEWNGLEGIIRDKLTARGLEVDQLGASALLYMAYDKNIISDKEYKSLLGLNTMRNLAVHCRAGDIDDERTHEFLTLSDAIKTVLYITNH